MAKRKKRVTLADERFKLTDEQQTRLSEVLAQAFEYVEKYRELTIPDLIRREQPAAGIMGLLARRDGRA